MFRLGLVVCGLVIPATAWAAGHGEFPTETISVGSATREYRLIVPASVDLDSPAPLVIAFHGMLIDSKDVMPRYTKLGEAAEKHKFLIAFPNAVGKSWGIDPKKVKDDLALFDALVAKLTSDYMVDPRRIYVLGMSNGSYFAHLVGKERSKTVAAVAAHSGPLGLQTLLGIRAERKFPVIIIHGEQDRLFPIAYARENRDKYTREGHEVKLVEIAGLGHFWGVKANINDTIWQFFAEHPLEA
jgi:polyhydroxybutyrate depolymerase